VIFFYILLKNTIYIDFLYLFRLFYYACVILHCGLSIIKNSIIISFITSKKIFCKKYAKINLDKKLVFITLKDYFTHNFSGEEHQSRQ